MRNQTGFNAEYAGAAMQFIHVCRAKESWPAACLSIERDMQ